MSFCKAESNFADDTFSGTVVDADAVAADAGETTSLPAGATDEEAVEAVAPLPNCPDRKICAALDSFDLMSCAGAVFCASLAEVTEGELAVGELAVSELPGTVGMAAAAMWILTEKLPLQGGVHDAFTAGTFTPTKRWPGPSALSCLPLPIRTGTPCACNLAINAPVGAETTGRPVLAAPLTPAGSQFSAEVEWNCRTSPVWKSTPVSVHGCAVEMVKE